MPMKPTEKYKKILYLQKEHQILKPNKIAKRFKFSLRDKNEGELLSEYLAELCC